MMRIPIVHHPSCARVTTTLGLLGCGGGDGGDEGSALTDTGLLFSIETGEEAEPPPPPATTAEEPQEAPQIAVPAPGESIGPQSPAARVTELQQVLLVLGFKIGTPDGIYGGKPRQAVSRYPEESQARAGRAGRAKDGEGDQQGALEEPQRTRDRLRDRAARVQLSLTLAE